MLVERDLPKGGKGTCNCRYKYLFGNEEAKTKHKKKDKETLIGWNEIMDYFVCSAEAHA